MRAHAVVIGINRYANAEWNLSGAVRDALRFARWARTEGGVAKEDLTLLLSPLEKDDEPIAPDLATIAEPTWDGISDALYKYKEGGAGDADRFWFYYAGHGLAAPGSAPEDGPVLVPCDIKNLDRYIDEKAIRIEHFREKMQDVAPPQQFFFVDACRDVLPVKAKMLTASILWDLNKVEPNSLRTQAVFLATTVGQRAKEIRGHGVFSERLDAALRGLGPELADPLSPLGVQHMRLLFNPMVTFVINAVKEAFRNDPEAARKSVPYSKLIGVTGDITVAEFPVNALPHGSLATIVEPLDARPTGHIEFQQFDRGRGQWVVCEEPPPFPSPIPDDPPPTFRLPGGTHQMLVQASGFKPVSQPVVIDRVASRIKVTLPRMPASALPPAMPSALESFSIEPAPTTGGIHATSNDRLVRLAVYDGGGEQRARGYENVSALNLAPGPYKVTAELTAAERVEHTVTVVAGRTEPVLMDVAFIAPDPYVQSLLALNNIHLTNKGYAYPAESLGPIANLRLASLLAYAAWGARWTGPLHHLRDLGVDPLPNLISAQCAVQVLIADALADEQTLGECRVFAGERQLEMQPLPAIPQARQGAIALPPGPARVRVEMAGFAPASFAVVLLPGLISVLVVVREVDGDIEVQQHLNPIDPSLKLIAECDPPEPDDVRLVEIAARALENRDPLDSIEFGGLIEGKRSNPMLAVIAGYRMFGTVRAGEFVGPLERMRAVFDGFPDLHVLAALYDPLRKDEHLEHAMERGTPVIAQGFWTLMQWLTASAAEQDALPPALRESVLPGVVWTAFSAPPVAAHADALRFVTSAGQTRIGEARRNERMAKAAEAAGLVEGDLSLIGTCTLVAPRIVLCPKFVAKDAMRVHFGAATFDVVGVQRELQGSEHVLVLLELSGDVVAEPLTIADALPQAGQAVGVIGFPQRDMRWKDVAFAEHFAGAPGEKHVMSGAVIDAPESGTSMFSHDCFTSVGTAGGPLIDLTTGSAVGVHIGGLPPSGGRKRGSAMALAGFAKRLR